MDTGTTTQLLSIGTGLALPFLGFLTVVIISFFLYIFDRPLANSPS